MTQPNRWYSKLEQCVNAYDASLVFAKDINKEGAKSFCYVESWTHFVNNMINIRETDRVFYEVIRPTVLQKPYFDIDFPETSNVSLEYADNIIGEIIECIETNLKEYFGYELNTPKDLRVCTSHSGTKKSFHLILMGYYVNGIQQNKEYCEVLLTGLSNEAKQFVDFSVYTKNRCFRTLYSHKLGSSRTKTMADNHQYGKYLICNDHGEEYSTERLKKEFPGLYMSVQFYESLITLVKAHRGWKQLVPKSVLPVSSHKAAIRPSREYENVELDDGTYQSILKLVPPEFNVKQQDISNRVHPIYCWRRSPSHCEICNRTHDKQHKFITLDGTQVLLWCFQDLSRPQILGLI